MVKDNVLVKYTAFISRWHQKVKLHGAIRYVVSRGGDRIQEKIRDLLDIQKKPIRGVLLKRCSENMQQIYRRTPLPKCFLFEFQFHQL